MALEGDRWTHGSHCGYRGAPGVPMPRTPKPSHHPPCPVIPLPGAARSALLLWQEGWRRVQKVKGDNLKTNPAHSPTAGTEGQI